MSDKFRVTFPISVTFTDGEMPTAAKLNAATRQARQGLSQLEYAIGDVWNQAGDRVLTNTSVSTNALMIANVARYLGAANLANPRVPALPDVEVYTYNFQNDAGNYEAVLTFPMAGGALFNWSGTGAPSGAPESNASDVDAAGEWYVDRTTGWCLFYDEIQSDWELEYKPVIEGDLGADATYNIIPDLTANSGYAFAGVKIEYVNGTDNSQGYYIYLPPRGPLDRQLDRSPQDDILVPAHSGNFTTTPATDSRHFWQADSVDGDVSGNGDHYRYVLPKIITNDWSQASAVPAGLVYLWDSNNTGTIIEGLAFSAENATVPRKWVLVVSGAALDAWLAGDGASAYSTANLQSSSHAASLYPSTGLKLVTVGSPISDAVSSIVEMLLNHDHSTSNSLPSMPVDSNKLVNRFQPVVSGRGHLEESALTNDPFPQYLHRYGADIVNVRDGFLGAMLGDILLANTDNVLDKTANSSRIYFGNKTGADAAFIGYNLAEDRITIHYMGSTGNNGGVRIGDSSSGAASYLDINIDDTSNVAILEAADELWAKAPNAVKLESTASTVEVEAAGQVTVVSDGDRANVGALTWVRMYDAWLGGVGDFGFNTFSLAGLVPASALLGNPRGITSLVEAGGTGGALQTGDSALFGMGPGSSGEYTGVKAFRAAARSPATNSQDEVWLGRLEAGGPTAAMKVVQDPNASTGRGCYLQEDEASYRVKQRTEWILVPLQNGLASGWTLTSDGRFQINTIGPSQNFFVNDFPASCDLVDIEMDWQATGGSGAQLNANFYKEGSTGALGSLPLNSATVTRTAGSRGVDKVTDVGGMTNHTGLIHTGLGHIIRIQLWQSVHTGPSYVWPWVRLQVRYTSVAKWQTIA
jgi:hypothetical protein